MSDTDDHPFKDLEDKENARRKAMGLPPLPPEVWRPELAKKPLPKPPQKGARKEFADYSMADVEESVREHRELKKNKYSGERLEKYMESYKTGLMRRIENAGGLPDKTKVKKISVDNKGKLGESKTESIVISDDDGVKAVPIESDAKLEKSDSLVVASRDELKFVPLDKMADKSASRDAPSAENESRPKSARERFKSFEKSVFAQAFPGLSKIIDSTDGRSDEGDGRTTVTIKERLDRFQRDVFKTAFPTLAKVIDALEQRQKGDSREKAREEIRGRRTLDKTESMSESLLSLSREQERTVDLLRELLDVVKGLRRGSGPNLPGVRVPSGLGQVARLAARAAPYALGAAAIGAVGYGAYRALSGGESGSTEAGGQTTPSPAAPAGVGATPTPSSPPPATSVRAEGGTFRRAGAGGGLTVTFERTADGKHYIDDREVDAQTYNRFMQLTRAGDPRRDPRHRQYTEEERARGDDFAPEFTADRRIRDEDNAELSRIIQTVRTQPRAERPATPTPAATPAAAPVPAASQPPSRPTPDASGPEGSDVGGLGLTAAQLQPSAPAAVPAQSPPPAAGPRISSGRPSRITGPRPAPVLGEGGDLAGGFAGGADTSGMGLGQQASATRTATDSLIPSDQVVLPDLAPSPRGDTPFQRNTPRSGAERRERDEAIRAEAVSRNLQNHPTHIAYEMSMRTGRLQLDKQYLADTLGLNIGEIAGATYLPNGDLSGAVLRNGEQRTLSGRDMETFQRAREEQSRQQTSASSAQTATSMQTAAAVPPPTDMTAPPAVGPRISSGRPSRITGPRPAPVLGEGADLAGGFAGGADATSMGLTQQTPAPATRVERRGSFRIGGLEVGFFASGDGQYVVHGQDVDEDTFNRFIEIKDRQIEPFDNEGQETRRKDLVNILADIRAGTTPARAARQESQPTLPSSDLARTISNREVGSEAIPKDPVSQVDLSAFMGSDLLLRARKVTFKGDEIEFLSGSTATGKKSPGVVPGAPSILGGGGGGQVTPRVGGGTTPAPSAAGGQVEGGGSQAEIGTGGEEPTGDVTKLSFAPGVDPRIKKDIAQKIQQIESSFGKKLTVTSGFRDQSRNAAAGGARNSAHTRANAVDIQFSGNQEDTVKLIEAASAAGIGGIGVYRPGWLHLDTESKRVWGPDFSARSIPEWAKPALEAHMSGKTKQDAQQVATEAPTPAMAAEAPAAPAASGGGGGEGSGSAQMLSETGGGSSSAAAPTAEESAPADGLQVATASQENAVAERTPVPPSVVVPETPTQGRGSPGVSAPSTFNSPNDPGPVEPADAAERYAKLFNMAA